MKLSTVATTVLSLGLGGVALQGVTPADLYLTLTLEQVYEGEAAPFYLAFPGLYTSDAEYSHRIGTYSSEESFDGFVNGPHGSSSTLFHDFEYLQEEATGSWRLIFGEDTDGPIHYYYDVDISALTLEHFPSFEILTPANGATDLNGDGLTVTWSAPDNIAFGDLHIHYEGSYVNYYPIAPGQTSLTIDGPMEPGEYMMTLSIYYQDVEEIVIGAPYQLLPGGAASPLAVNGLPFDWVANNQLRLTDRHFFTVVPEPAHYAAFTGLLALIGLGYRRLRK